MGDKKRKKDISRTGNTGGRNASISDAVNKVAKTVTKVATQKVQAPANKGNIRSGTRNNTQKTTVNKSQSRATTNRNAGRANQNRTSFNERMNRYSAPSRKEINAQVTKPLKDNVSGIVKGTAKRYAGQQLYGANDTANDLMDYFKMTSKTTGGDIGIKVGTEAFKFAYDNTIGKSNENLSRKNIKKSMKRKGGELQESGQKDIEDVKKGKSNVGKFGVDLASTGMELGLDALLTRGRGTTAAMYNRAYGGAKKAAVDEGANEEQAKLYGKASGLLEMGTEKMFSVAKPLQKLYGKGAGDDITEVLLQKVTSKMTSNKGKNAVYHGGKTLTAAITEGLEEMVSEGLEPEIANRIYAEAVGKPHETSVKDIAYAGLLGGTMGGILGGGGQIVEYGQGKQVQEVFGEDGVKDLAHKVKESDEDSGSNLMGAAIEEMINAGDSIVAGQARMLYQAAEEQKAKDIRRSDITRTSADAIIQKENLVAPTQVDSETGQEFLGKATARTFDTVKTKAVDVAVELQMPELNSEQISDAVAKIQTGVAGVNEVNLFTIGNPKARTIYEVVTGKSLPKTNKETRETLYEQIALNRINAARAETESYVDRVKGIIQQNLSSGYESAGQRLFANEFGDVDVRNASQVEAAVITFDDFYRAGRNSIAYSDVIAMDNSVHQSMPESMRKAAWEAGQQDKILASDNAKGMQTVIGKTAKETRSNRQKTGSKGKLISELSPEMKEEFTASQQTVLRALARSFNINIHVMDSLENNANGMYVDGEVYLSISGDRALPYIFAHEITHHMQSYAPKEYNQLKELVRQNWASRGGMDEAVDTKVAEYARHNVKLSREDALDEIIADSTYEMLQDEGFVDELCKSRRNIAQAVLDAIKNVLVKLRAVLAEGEGFTPVQNENLLSQLEILKEFERIWADGLARAAENSDAVGRLEQNNVRYSKNSEGSAIREQLRANLDVLKDMDTVADVKYESIKHLNRAQKADAIMREYDKKFKGGIERKDFGFIVIRKDEITNSLKYLHTDGEFAAFKALPQVLKRGEIIDEHINHKGRTIDTVTIAAPVIINGTSGYMAAAVKVGGKNRYHVHRILMPDGSEFEFNKKTEPIGAGMITVSSKQGSAISSVSDNSINQSSKNDNKKFSLNDSDGNKLTQEQAEYFKDSKVRDENGDLLVLYHQTDEDFNIFDTRREGAGTRDNGTPYGIFLKPDSKDIGLRGKKQMALYADITNPLKVTNRAELDRILKEDKDYAAVRKELNGLDAEYGKKFDEAKKVLEDFITNWSKDNPDAGRTDIYDDPEFNKVYEAEDKVVEEWTAKVDELSAKCKELINEYLNRKGYDGIILEEDAGSFGRKTKAYIALDPHQVKNTDNLSPTENPDIRYSIAQDNTGKDVVVVQDDIFRGREGEKRKKVVAEYLKSHIGDMFTIIENGKRVYLGKDLPNEYNYSRTTKKLGRDRRYAKQKAAPGIGEMIEIATNERWETPVHKEKHEVDAKYGFYKYDTRFAVQGRDGEYEVYDAEIVVRHNEDGKLYLYDIQGIKKGTAAVRVPLDESHPAVLSEESRDAYNGTSINSISETEGNNNKKFSIKDSDTSRTITVTTIRGETKTITGAGKNLLTGETWNEEQWERWKRGMEADYIGAETTHEAIESEKYLYAPYQEGTANAENFMWNTVAMFEGVKGRPRRNPDYVSYSRDGKVSSEYWYTDDGVIRGSKHWGENVASCDWGHSSVTGRAGSLSHTNKIYGKAKWTEFVQKPEVISTADGKELGRTNFNNTTGRGEVIVDGKEYVYDRFDRAWYPASEQEKNIRFSFAGENALNKDNEMLRKAKNMYNDFEDSETIRKETGWHLGADGKWRFEIDDSQMEVFTAGDALFRKEHPEYARLQELYDKFWGEGVSEKEQKEMEELEETWGDDYARLHKRLESGNAYLVNVIQHDVLFENYPQLENVKVKIDNLNGASGAYVVNGYEIKIDKELFKSDYRKVKRNATLVHEIQHAIQDIEKFAKGANLEMLDTATQRAESEAESAGELYDKAADNLTDILDSAGYYEKYGDYVDITSEDEQQRIRTENIPGANEALDNFNYCREKYFELTNKKSSLENMSAVDFYKYSAGEVEARDAGKRAAYNAAEREAVRPDIDSSSIITEDYIRYSLKEDADISYESLVSKPDMEVAKVTTEREAVEGLNRKSVVNNAKKALEEKVGVDSSGRTVIHNNDTGLDIVAGKPGIEHGLDRNYIDTAIISMHLDEYLGNAIKINEALPDGGRKRYSDILLGYGEGKAGEKMPAYFVVSKLTTGKDVLADFGTLYSIRGKKIEDDSAQGSPGVQSRTSSTISISDLLDIVNEMYSDILPKSVAEHYGNEQRETKLGESVKYSLPDSDLTNEYINGHETEFIEVPPVRDYERRAAEGRIQSVGELQKQVERLRNEKKLTHGKILDTRGVREEMNKLVRTLMSRSEGTQKKTNHKLVNVGMDNISAIYRDIVEGDYASAANTAWYTAKEIVQNLEFVDDTLFYEYKDLRDYLRTTKITLSEQDKAGFTDFKEFRGANMGRLRIVNNGGMAVDDVYEILCEKYPGLFDYEITHPVDQLRAMADVRESLEPYDIMLNSEEMEQLTKQAAQDIIDIATEGKPWKSFADRKKEVYEQRLKQTKARHKEAMHELREVKNDELRRKLQKERNKKNEAVTKEREKRKEAVAKEKQKHKDYKENQKSRREHVKHYGRIFKNYKWLADRLVKPTDDKHIPQEFRTALAHMLQHFDFQTERSKALEEKYGPAQNTIRMYELKARFEEIAKEDGSGMFEYDGYIFDLMKSLAIKLDGKSIDQASNEDLAAIDTLLKAITTNVRNYNRAFSEEIYMTISDLAQKTIASNDERVEKYGKHADRSGIMGGVDSILNESMVTPRDFFEQVGGGLQDAFMAMRKGFDKHIDNLTKTRDFFDEVFKPYNKKTRLRKRAKPGSEVEKWRDSTMLEEIKLESGKTIKMNPAQMMTLYCSMKREQARGHILGSGIVVSKVDNTSKIKRALGAKMQTEGATVMISTTDANNIISKLTEEQIEMADKLQSFLNNECAEWGNEVSMRMYGYRKFTEKEYFPIKSADAYLDSNFEGRQPAERIKNFGFTKGTVTKANNPIMIDDIFRVVSDHINKMSLYNAFAAPISDFTRVYNYRERDDSGLLETSVKSSLEDTYGKKVINYINNFMADVNNTAQTRTEGVTKFVNNSLAAYKKSIIGGNLRVALQQPTAVMRAFMLISPKYFVGGNVNVAKNLKDMMEHCQIARWKSWGHNQVDMARDIDEIMMNNEWGYVDAVTMEIYGALDNATWSTIWAAVRKETKSKRPDVKENSEEFYQICNERASEIFDKTQVVDSVFHRSQVMRNTDIMSKMVTSFMAEPTRTFNMMRTEYVKAREMWNDGDKAKAVMHANKATSIFTLNAALVSAAAAVADVLRDRAPGDDEDDTSWLTNFLANFWDNVNPINMIPVAKDIWGFKDGWGTQNMALEGYEALVQSVMELGTAEDKAEAMRKVAEGLGLVTGLPVKNVLREVESISKVLGINVFAAEGGEETSKEEPGFLDKLINSFNIADGTPFDNVLNRVGLNRTEAEQRAADEDKKVRTIERSIKGLSGEERQEKIWSEVTDNYTNYIEDGDFDSIKSMRSMLVALGGDVDKFDESVQGKMKTALKKSLGENIPMVQRYKNYLINECGMTEGKINQEVIMTSETAKNFQLAACTNDEVNMILSMADLYAAGLTDSEIDTLYATRSSAVKGKDFSTGEFAYPVSGEITSTFGYRDQPTAGATTYHEGIDIGVPMGSNVAAADGGKVSSVGYNSGLGYYVKIDHGNGRYTTYAHLSGYYVDSGDAVTKGQTIALSGSTGVSTGPHLHFAVQENGTYVDPMGYFN